MRPTGLRWWSAGVRFECQRSGRCCVSRGGYGYVYLTLADRRLLAASLGLPTREFTKRYCEKTEGHIHLKEKPGRGECLFLDGTSCGVYEARPVQCRTWPFWPELMKPKEWCREVRDFCPGVGKGRLHSEDEIEKVLEIQRRADHQY